MNRPVITFLSDYYEDARGALALNTGSAAERLRASVDDEVMLRAG